ncbi:hypothetical protein [Methylomagnum sp.]
MPSEAVVTITKMVEVLPDATQEQVVEHLREYLEDLRDEARWDEQFRRTRPKLAEVARQARQDIAEGKAQRLDCDDL